MNVISPVLLTVERMQVYGEQNNLHNESVWAVDYLVTIGDKNDLKKVKSLPWFKKTWYFFSPPASFNMNGSIGYDFYLLVCSPSYLRDPNKEHTADDLDKALIQPVLDEDAVRQYLQNRIEKIGPQEWNELIKKLNAFLDTEDAKSTEGLS